MILPVSNYVEGKGTTGYTIAIDNQICEVGTISAQDYDSPVAYWYAHILLLEREMPTDVVMEGFRLYNHRGMSAKSQANSLLETPQLIGGITIQCHKMNIPLTIQFAKDVKTRWKDEILTSKNIITKSGRSYMFNGKVLSNHEKDAIRHMMHFIRYGKK